jgi:hypothetical protein
LTANTRTKRPQFPAADSRKGSGMVVIFRNGNYDLGDWDDPGS